MNLCVMLFYYSTMPILCFFYGEESANTTDCLLTCCRITHSIVAGSVDNVNLLEVPIQEVSAYGQDITAATIVLLYCHGLGQPRARH